MDKRESYFNNIEGYKIIGGHLKLGSRIHITDYFYAKRLFYNSFFTNRFAFLISQYIINNYSVHINKLPKDSKVTLIGYEMYSELLVSSIRKILNDQYIREHQEEKFNHHIYKRDKLFSKDPNKISESVILITPISTTFSTSIRIKTEIKNTLQSKYNKTDVNFLEPYISCLVIGNKESFVPNDGAMHIYEQKDIEYEYGWQKAYLNEGIVEIKPQIDKYSKDSNIKIKYFIPLNTDWVKTYNCFQCYPDKANTSLELTKEKVLIETDKNSLVPDLIFEYPRTKASDTSAIFNKLNFRDNKNRIVLREHFKKNNSNYIYYVKAGQFLKNNKDDISENWIRRIKDTTEVFKSSKNIVIITPTGGSNSGFVNLVNDKLFNDNATIIQYDVKNELIHNFQIFYKNIIQSADKILFVDDVMATAEAFGLINFYVKNIRGKIGVDFALCLINRLGFFNEKKLLSKLPEAKGFLYYLRANVPPIPYRNEYPYTRLKSSFKHLANNSVLDMMQMHFREREGKFKPVNLNTTANIDDKISEHKSLFQFLLEHELNNLFDCSEEKNSFNYSEKDKIISFFQDENHKALLRYFRRRESIKGFLKYYPIYKSELKNLLLKIFTIEPYIRFHNIKKSAFKWVITDLSNSVNKICSPEWDKEGFFEVDKLTKYSEYHSFKFLLKRATKLNMNYIYSIDMLKAVRVLLSNFSDEQQSHSNRYVWNIEKNKYNLIKDDKNIFIFGFTTYYVSLIQELIVDHEAKAIELVKNIKKMLGVINKDRVKKVNLLNDYNDSFLHLLRLLVLENTFIFKTFCDKFIAEVNNDSKQPISFETIDYSIISGKLDLYNKNDIYIFQGVKQMLSKFDDNVPMPEHNPQLNLFESFKQLVVAKTFISNDIKQKNNIGQIGIKKKILKILELSCKILGVDNGGAFLVLKYKGEEKDTNYNNLNVIGEYYTSKEHSLIGKEKIEDSIVNQMFEGIYELKTNKPRSTFEVSLCNEDQYHYRKSFKENSDVVIDLKDKIELNGSDRYRNLFFLRIAKIKRDKSFNENGFRYKSSPIAVICFYNNTQIEADKETYHYKRFDPKLLRLLLLLREDIQGFINHHLINDSLRAFVEEQNRLIDYSAPGHGEEITVNELHRVTHSHIDKWQSDYYQKYAKFLMLDLSIKHQIKESFPYLAEKIGEERKPYLVKNKLQEYFDFVFNGELTDNKDSSRKINFISDDVDFGITLNKNVFLTLMKEVFINCKKGGVPGEDIQIELIDLFETKKIRIFNLMSDPKDLSDYDKRKIKRDGYRDKKTKGLYLNYLICKNLQYPTPIYDIDDKYFYVTYNFSKNE
ncbi:hypothetical protein [Winogradskyella jejuensis]|uniref:Uncharacterized protein n=1 Tax=Winogradskyella jejuensis TaxID=1089305 RepID=A0A1M5UXT4_9FLAO|nr:hypothetical protein [Winogradskyella jejuensis]SHH67805.1 hypothetical protein SAMN05444148_2643 [Winogradskyella jejuensis]